MGRFIPNAKKLLVRSKQEDGTTKTESGLFVIDNMGQADDTTRGTVVEVGEKATQFSIGDDIVYPPYAGTKVIVDGEDLILLEPEAVWGKYVD